MLICRDSKIDELQLQADEAARLKDQVDEYRHAAEKLAKTENVMEKYKKKLEESADLRRRVKVRIPRSFFNRGFDLSPRRIFTHLGRSLSLTGFGRTERHPCRQQRAVGHGIPQGCIV